jgi:hypothetical protein
LTATGSTTTATNGSIAPLAGGAGGPIREDAEIETFSHVTVHVARIAHRNGYIQPGDTYRRMVYGGYIGPCREYPKGGPRWLRVYKLLVKRAEEAA